MSNRNAVRLVTLDPAHFHAALVQKTMLPGVDTTVRVYAPLGPDLIDYLQRIVGFNTRAKQPTDWSLDICAGSDFLTRLQQDDPGDVVILAGRNRDKIRRIHAALDAGLHVLADKPWILVPEDLPLLEQCLRLARRKGLLATDILTERYEITSILQRDLMQRAEIFGTLEPGSPDDPAVVMESGHGLIKTVTGVPLKRPASFFDPEEQGEALTDVGIHLVDLVQWMAWPRSASEALEIEILEANRWPTVLTREDFARITGMHDYPPRVANFVVEDRLHYPGNHRIRYRQGGVHVRLDVRWDRECPQGDEHFARIHGTRSTLEVRQGPEEGHRPEVYVVPRRPDESAAIEKALGEFVSGWRPGATLTVLSGPRFRVGIPPEERVGHEAHFGQVAAQFLRDLHNPHAVPEYEDMRTLARYRITTRGAALARSGT